MNYPGIASEQGGRRGSSGGGGGGDVRDWASGGEILEGISAGGGAWISRETPSSVWRWSGGGGEGREICVRAARCGAESPPPRWCLACLRLVLDEAGDETREPLPPSLANWRVVLWVPPLHQLILRGPRPALSREYRVWVWARRGRPVYYCVAPPLAA